MSWGVGYVVGPGTLATAGTTNLTGIGVGAGGGPPTLDGGLTWSNSGTFLGNTEILLGFYDASSLSYAVTNQATGTFDYTSDLTSTFAKYNGATATFTNAGLVEKTAGAGVLNFNALLTNTGTVIATSGTIDLNGGGTLGGTIGGARWRPCAARQRRRIYDPRLRDRRHSRTSPTPAAASPCRSSMAPR